MPDVHSRALGMAIMPDLMSGASVDSPDILGDSEVQDSVNQQWGRFNECRLICLKGPCQRKVPDVFRSDLGESTVPTSRVVAMISRPTVGGRVQQHMFVHSLRGERPRVASVPTATKNTDRKTFMIERSPTNRRRTLPTNGESVCTPSDCECRHLCIC